MPPSHGGSHGFESRPVHHLRCVGFGVVGMSLRNFLIGLIFVLMGMVVMLVFSVESGWSSAEVVKWLGVVLLIGGPLLFWEILPLGTEPV